MNSSDNDNNNNRNRNSKHNSNRRTHKDNSNNRDKKIHRDNNSNNDDNNKKTPHRRMYGGGAVGADPRHYDPSYYYADYGNGGAVYYANAPPVGYGRGAQPAATNRSGVKSTRSPIFSARQHNFPRSSGKWTERAPPPPPPAAPTVATAAVKAPTNIAHEAHTRISVPVGPHVPPTYTSPPTKKTLADAKMLEILREGLAGRIRTERSLVREFLAELIGTFFLLLIGISANIQAAASPGGNVVSAQLAWGFGFAFAVYLAVNVSGGHLNPAISFSSLVTGDLSLFRFFLYVVAQLLGAFIGTAIAFVGHYDDIRKMDNGTRQVFGTRGTAGLLTTFPAEHMTRIGALADQIIGTAILAGVLCLLTDRKHRISTTMIPLLAGVTLTMIAMTFGANAGFAVNPARDLGPRIFALCVGYGTGVFSAANYYFWVPIVGPMIGALIGSVLYKLFIGVHGLSEQVEITGGQPYPRDDRGYKEYSSNTSIGMDNLISYNSFPK